VRDLRFALHSGLAEDADMLGCVGCTAVSLGAWSPTLQWFVAPYPRGQLLDPEEGTYVLLNI
jgi:hypothetical protein